MQTELDNSTALDELAKNRELVYAALLRFTPEAKHLRERAIDQIVLDVFRETTKSSALNAGKVRRKLEKTSALPPLRIETVSEGIQRLLKEGLLEKLEEENQRKYFISEQGNIKLRTSSENFAVQLQEAVGRHLKDFDTLSKETAEKAFRVFLVQCFSRIGRLLADTVLGRRPTKHVNDHAEVDNAIKIAITECRCPNNSSESLKTRLRNFLKSEDPSDQQVKFQLSQAFYLAQLLEIDSTQFSPLADDAFRGAILYVDTNVLIRWLLDFDENRLASEEIAKICLELGIKLVVTRATLNEASKVANDRRDSLEQVIQNVPKAITGQSKDQFLLAFTHAQDDNPNITPSDFLRKFEQIDVAAAELNLEIEEITESDLTPASEEKLRVEYIMQSSVAVLRPSKKGKVVLDHDIFHYFLVVKQRKTNPRTWFLTHDQTLIHAAKNLKAEPALPFCYPMLGFIQSLCPFISKTRAENAVTAFFNALLVEQLSLSDTTFDLKDLALLAKHHEDVLATPPEALIPALDHVKHNILHGGAFDGASAGKVAIELRKHLHSSSDKREEHLLTEARIATDKANVERTHRNTAEQLAKTSAERLSALEIQFSDYKQSTQHKEEANQENLRKTRRNFCFAFTIVGFLAALLIGSLDSQLKNLLRSLPGPGAIYLVALSIFSISIVVIPSVLWVRNLTWAENRKRATIMLIIAIALAGSNVVGTEPASEIVQIWKFAEALGLIVFGLFGFSRRPHSE